MKERKKDVSSGSKQSPKLNRWLNNAGLGLPELMVAVASSMVVILGVATVMNMGVREFSVIYEQNKTLESLERASFYLRLYVQNGVNVYAVNTDAGIPIAPAVPAGMQADPSRGYVGGYDIGGGTPGFDSELGPLFGAAAKDGRVIPLAVFLSEQGSYRYDAAGGATGYLPGTTPASWSRDGSDFRATALFWQFPQAGFSGRFSSGVIWLDTNADVGAMPSSDDLWFDRMTKLRMEVIPAPVDPPNPNGPAWQIDFQFTARYYLLPDQRSWFYDLDGSAAQPCPPEATRFIFYRSRREAGS